MNPIDGVGFGPSNRGYTSTEDISRFYQAVADFRATNSAEATANAFANNPYGVSFQELLGTVPTPTVGAVDTFGYGGTGGTGEVAVNLSSKIQALNDLYGIIYNDLAGLTQEKRTNLESDYGDQTKNLQTTYERVAAQLPQQYGAQGIGQSSYYAKAAGGAQDLYNQQTQELQKAQTKSMADLGQWYQSNLGQYQGQQAALGGYGGTGTQADAAALDTQLNQLGQARTGLQTQGQNIAGLNAIAPTQNTGAAQLQKILGELAVSSIPDFAKQTIAKGKIQQSGQDQAFYTDYFDKLRQQTPVT